MKRRSVNLVVLLVLGIFAIAMLLVGQNHSSMPQIVTIKIDGISDEEIASKVEKALQLMEGINSFVLDPRTKICTLRLNTQKVHLSSIEKRLSALGLKVTPMEKLQILNIGANSPRKLFSIRFSSAK